MPTGDELIERNIMGPFRANVFYRVAKGKITSVEHRPPAQGAFPSFPWVLTVELNEQLPPSACAGLGDFLVKRDLRMTYEELNQLVAGEIVAGYQLTD